MVIHPDQVQVVNEIFTPNQETIARAGEILDAFAKAGKGTDILIAISLRPVRGARRS